ncbi:Acetyl-CoA C-acyltransferase [Ceratobasidium theobromae]|uniref:Acetyl-CoA C-acyltransferase n=1 Tax=Ceratobasidium theobromae TaxID=1582974 RepID=A0A5N5QKH0_9AGAM|nr:Acetyl-CoA C-acyltransferase [Ceratobasidium theobromae]
MAALSAARAQAYIVAAKRTPFGAFGGTLKDLKASELGGLASRAALSTLPKETRVDSVIFGLCGSGFQSLINAVQEIQLGESNIVLTGGTENMSMAPYTLHGTRFGNARYGVDQKLVDSLAAALVDQVPGATPGAAPTPMGITAENLAQKYGITREQCDAYALRSQQRWAAAQESGAFEAEISPVELKTRKGTQVHTYNSTTAEITQIKWIVCLQMFSVDEHPRPTATLEALAKLPSVFIKNTGTVSAGNASGIGDGAAANVVASEEACKQYNLPKLARIAFAAQWLAVQKELELPDEKSNVFGGAIALAHPLGASGARIVANMVHNLRRLNKKYGVGAACIGGGQGIAVVLERV